MSSKRKRRTAAKPVADVLKPIITSLFIATVAFLIIVNKEILHYAWHNQIQDVLLLAVIIIILFFLILFVFKKK